MTSAKSISSNTKMSQGIKFIFVFLLSGLLSIFPTATAKNKVIVVYGISFSSAATYIVTAFLKTMLGTEQSERFISEESP